LGNPVLKVEVRDVPPEPATPPAAAASGDGGFGDGPGEEDPEALHAALNRITARLERLERLLEAR
jgi:hypothetical protein